MSIALITGSAGLIGSSAVRFFAKQGMKVVGIDNDMRKFFFGRESSTEWSSNTLREEIDTYVHKDIDVRDQNGIERIFQEYGKDITLVLHAAAQPSDAWAAKDPFTDFSINANGTLVLLEMTRRYSPGAVFVFTSTNKVYGNAPNKLPIVEHERRLEVASEHAYYRDGIDERIGIDQTRHSLFGCSKVAADELVQDYGRQFDIKSAVFRIGSVSGPHQSPAMLHGFLGYLTYCALTDTPYTILGHGGKQVRDVLHVQDLISAFNEFYQTPRVAEVYNMGGGRDSSCSILEAISLVEELTGKSMNISLDDAPRVGDLKWWITNNKKFQGHYPTWKVTRNLSDITKGITNDLTARS